MTWRPRIMVVDGESAIQELLRRMLQEEGYLAVATDDGRLAWSAALAAGEPFDLLITNWFCPYMTGAEIAMLLQREYPGAPILHLEQPIFTPFSRDRLLGEVRRLLVRHQTPHSAWPANRVM